MDDQMREKYCKVLCCGISAKVHNFQMHNFVMYDFSLNPELIWRANCICKKLFIKKILIT